MTSTLIEFSFESAAEYLKPFIQKMSYAANNTLVIRGIGPVEQKICVAALATIALMQEFDDSGLAGSFDKFCKDVVSHTSGSRDDEMKRWVVAAGAGTNHTLEVEHHADQVIISDIGKYAAIINEFLPNIPGVASLRSATTELGA